MKLTLMVGVPGSGKSHLAKTLGGVIVSTDDIWMCGHIYCFCPQFIGVAHQITQAKTKLLIDAGVPHIIIDNTNLTEWERKSYIEMANGYTIELMEPNTEWRYDAEECHRRNQHKVPLETIKKMLEKLEKLKKEL